MLGVIGIGASLVAFAGWVLLIWFWNWSGSNDFWQITAKTALCTTYICVWAP